MLTAYFKARKRIQEEAQVTPWQLRRMKVWRASENKDLSGKQLSEEKGTKRFQRLFRRKS
jgi:hypothetical protein